MHYTNFQIKRLLSHKNVILLLNLDINPFLGTIWKRNLVCSFELKPHRIIPVITLVTTENMPGILDESNDQRILWNCSSKSNCSSSYHNIKRHAFFPFYPCKISLELVNIFTCNFHWFIDYIYTLRQTKLLNYCSHKNLYAYISTKKICNVFNLVLKI